MIPDLLRSLTVREKIGSSTIFDRGELRIRKT